MKKILIVIITIIFSVTAAEYVCRAFWKQKAERIHHGGIELKGAYRYKPHPVLGYERIPGENGANKYGMFGNEYPVKRDDNTYRILSIGDSVTEWPGFGPQLEKNLNSKSEKKIEIWHNALGGYGILQYRNFIKIKTDDINPDMVLINFCLNDTWWYTFCTFEYGNEKITYAYNLIDENEWWYSENLFEHSALYRLLLLRLLVMQKDKKNRAEKKFQQLLEEIRNHLKEQDIFLCAAVYPYLMKRNDYEIFEKRSFELIIKSCNDLKIPVIDLYNTYFTNSSGNFESLRENPNDKLHSNWDITNSFVISTLKDFIISLLKDSVFPD